MRCSQFMSNPLKAKYSLAFFLILVLAISSVAELARTREDLERQYEAQLSDKISKLVDIPGALVQTSVEMDILFQVREAGCSIRIPRKEIIKKLSGSQQKNCEAIQALTME